MSDTSHEVGGSVTQSSPDDLFPYVRDRYLYEHAALRRVTFRVRFPQILRLESDIPADFQDRIRDKFPLVKKDPERPAGISENLTKLLGSTISAASYRFADENDTTRITVRSKSLEVSTRAYERWEPFCDLVMKMTDCFASIYRPSFIDRIGLQFLNVFRRDEIGLHGVPWSELINNQLLGVVASEWMQKSTADHKSMLRYRNASGSFLLNHGFYQKDSRPDANVYYLDCDFYQIGRFDVAQIPALLDRHHRRGRRLFQWAISTRLHEAMGPTPCPD